MTAIYSLQDNTLTEQPDLDLPPDKPESKFYGNDRETFQRDLAAWRRVMQDFEFHKARYEKTLRTIPAHESARSLWKDGQKVEEGKDYEVKYQLCPRHQILHEGGHCEYCLLEAFPLPVKIEQNEDELWKDVLAEAEASIDWQYQELAEEELITKLKSRYIITKR